MHLHMGTIAFIFGTITLVAVISGLLTYLMFRARKLSIAAAALGAFAAVGSVLIISCTALMALASLV
ncbi:hypothetical protein ACFXHA_43495 [Nocardia sp. NPDC059240]|uniref:hypothetical protein n=1 Tax=Nocardia sp. NPDC059240 TaxID=3346786 RepID=UPI003691028F